MVVGSEAARLGPHRLPDLWTGAQTRDQPGRCRETPLHPPPRYSRAKRVGQKQGRADSPPLA